MTNIAIFASGTGTNAENIIRYFKDSDKVRVAFVLVDNPTAQARERAKNLGVPTFIRMRPEFKEPTLIMPLLDLYQIDLIVLAGSLIFLPEYLTSRYDHRILNIHPSLIPSFCGQGYYGLKVHEAALKKGVKVTGATVHFVNEIPDGGEIIAQKAVYVEDGDTPETLQKRVMEQAEWIILPQSVEKIAKQIINS